MINNYLDFKIIFLTISVWYMLSFPAEIFGGIVAILDAGTFGEQSPIQLLFFALAQPLSTLMATVVIFLNMRGDRYMIRHNRWIAIGALLFALMASLIASALPLILVNITNV